MPPRPPIASTGWRAALKESGNTVENLVDGVATGLESTRASLAAITRLESVARIIDKVVGAISLVVVQTSMLAVSGAVEAGARRATRAAALLWYRMTSVA